MANDRSKRINPKILAEDIASLEGLATVTDYAPANASLTPAKLKSLLDAMNTSRATETQALATAAAARDNAAAAEWDFHEAIVGMRDQVVAQHGRASNQAQSVGRKKDTERKPPGGGKTGQT